MDRKVIVFVLLAVLLPLAAFGATPSLQSYRQSFSQAHITEKANVLKSAASEKNAGEFIGPLYDYALRFALLNSKSWKNDADMNNLIIVAVKGMEDLGYRGSLGTLWELFLDYQHSETGVEILLTLGKLGKGNRGIIRNLNHYLSEQNEFCIHGMDINYPVVSACITAIMELEDSSSYQSLFGVLYAGYPEVIVFEATGALDLIPGDYRQFLFNVVQNNPLEEKFAAFRAGINSNRLSLPDHGQLAELALERCLEYESTEENIDLSALYHAAVQTLTQLRWTRASALAVRHYYRAQADYQQGAVSKEHFLEAISLLGAAGDTDAAMALALQLGLFNAQAEKRIFSDPEIVLVMIRALGLIGDKAAFDSLFNVRYFRYPQNIQAAAREALDLLKW